VALGAVSGGGEGVHVAVGGWLHGERVSRGSSVHSVGVPSQIGKKSDLRVLTRNFNNYNFSTPMHGIILLY